MADILNNATGMTKEKDKITSFLSPYEVPDITGDELDVDKALSDKPDLDVDSDTIVVNLSDPEAKPKVLNVTLPPKMPEKAPDSSIEPKTEPQPDNAKAASKKTPKTDNMASKDGTKETAKEEKPEVNVNVTVNNNDNIRWEWFTFFKVAYCIISGNCDH